MSRARPVASIGRSFFSPRTTEGILQSPSRIHSVLFSTLFENVRQFSSTNVSLKCAPLSSTPVLSQSWSRKVFRPWMCVNDDCRHVNKFVLPQCEKCATDKPLLKGWKCSKCNTKNLSGVKRCKECDEPVETTTNLYWMCIVCNENNRIDELDDNSRCGFCAYDMAPLTLTEEEAKRIVQEQSELFQQQQEQFDSISPEEAEKQFGDVHAFEETLPSEIREPMNLDKTSESPKGAPLSAPEKVPKVKPFVPAPIKTSHSRLHRTTKVILNDEIPPGPPGFDWMCREAKCGHINPGDEEHCMKCGTHITPCDWECLFCGAFNHLSRSQCFNCKKTIKLSWTCLQCTMNTSIYDSTCRGCGSTRPPTEPKPVREVNESTAPRSIKRPDWFCSACNAMNFAFRKECFQCGSVRTASSASASGSFEGGAESEMNASAINQNNWHCSKCQSNNFRTRTTCWQCGNASPHATSPWASETVAPLFEKEGFQDGEDDKPAEGTMNVWEKKNDDWTCGKCFTKNFKNRKDCYKCGASKSVAITPRRTVVRKPVKL